MKQAKILWVSLSVIFALVLTGITTTVWAESFIYGCVNTKTGKALRIVGADTICKKNEQKVIWPAEALLAGNYAGMVKVTNVKINGGTNQAHVSPGVSFTVAFDYNYTIDFCPGCYAQLYVGLSSESGTVQCPYYGVPGASPGHTALLSTTLTAPTANGVYYVGVDVDLNSECFGGGGPYWPHGAPVTNDRVIGSISVY